jgi:hypothetical protein
MLVNGCVASPISAKACEAYGANPYYGCNKWVSPAPAWRRAECAAQVALECEALHASAPRRSVPLPPLPLAAPHPRPAALPLTLRRRSFYPYERCYISETNTLLTPVVFNYGIVSRGLLGVIIDYVQRVREAVLEQQQLIALGPAHIAFRSIDKVSPLGVGPLTTGQLVNEMASAYLAGGLQSLASNIQSEVEGLVTAAVNIDALAVAFSSLTLPVFVLVFYRPLILHLDADIKRSRALLMLVPDEIAKVVPAIVNAGQKLMQTTD